MISSAVDVHALTIGNDKKNQIQLRIWYHKI